MFSLLTTTLAIIGGFSLLVLIAFIGAWFRNQGRKSFKSENGLNSCSYGGGKLLGVNDNENLIAFQSDSWQDLKVPAGEVERVELRINGKVVQSLEPQKSSQIEVVRKFAVDQQNLVVAGIDAEHEPEQLRSLTLAIFSSNLPLGHIHTFWEHKNKDLKPRGFADDFEYSQWWLRRIRSLIVGERDQDVEEFFQAHG
ncbi:hypothetical protein RYZ27_01455 [Hyphomonas sp. FCG-A18]|uniref:hypothetical protein n=1 Tax=Hyphomonas sp. FCG-A18 TaxID=3080019 RepID=UPI002B30AE4E|nr:hypothetical protein RYZ27_01455 [Hyphomonas sp. FCG-A18]